MTDTEIDLAVGYLDANRPNDAQRILADYLASNPTSVRALCALAQVQLVLKDPRSALQTTQLAIAQQPESEWAWRLKSLANSVLKDYQAAWEAAQTARRIRPSSWLNQAQVAQVDASRGRIGPDTDAALAEMLRLAPNESQSHLVVGNVELARKNWSAAEEHFRLALSINPNNSTAQNNLAVTLLRAGKPGQAAGTLTNLLAVEPRSQLALKNLLSAVHTSLHQVQRILAGGLVLGYQIFVIHFWVSFAHWALIVVPVLEVCAVGYYLFRFRRRSGHGFVQFVSSLRRIDPLLFSWGLVLASVIPLMIAAIFVPLHIAQVFYGGVVVLLLASLVISRQRGIRVRNEA